MKRLHRSADARRAESEDWHGELRGGQALNDGPVELAVGDALVAALHPDPDEAAREAGYALAEYDRSLGYTEKDVLAFAASDCGRRELLPQARHAAAHAVACVRAPSRRRAAFAAHIGYVRLLRGYQEDPGTYIPEPSRDMLAQATEAWPDDDPLAALARAVCQEIEPADDRQFARALRTAWGSERRDAAAVLEASRGEEAAPATNEELARRYLLNAIVLDRTVPTITECTRAAGCTRQAAAKWPVFRAEWDRAKDAERASPKRGYVDARTGQVDAVD